MGMGANARLDVHGNFTGIFHESEAFVCKALKGEAIVRLLRVFNNAADENLRLALWVKIDEKKRSSIEYTI